MTEFTWNHLTGSGSFTNQAFWTPNGEPGVGDDAVLPSSSKSYIVSDHSNVTVQSIQVGVEAFLSISANFTASAGTGRGSASEVFVESGRPRSRADLTFGGTFDNVGEIQLASPAAYGETNLIIDNGSGRLTGGGSVVLDQSSGERPVSIFGSGATPALINIDNTIVGAGSLLVGRLAFTNGAKGVVDATRATAFDIASAKTVSATLHNSGLIEATNLYGYTATGGLRITNVTVSNTASGVIQADGAYTHVDLSGGTIIGGTLRTEDGGIINVFDASSTLNGSTRTVSNDGTVAVFGEDTLTSLALLGAIANSGTISLTSQKAVAEIVIGAKTTLSGGGDIVLSDDTRNEIVATANGPQGAVLTNANNTISGAGALGNARLTLVNQAGGVIDGNRATALTIDTGARTISNAGLIEGSGVGGTMITGAVSNSGTLAAAGGGLTVLGAVTGAGVVSVNGGRASFGATFSENVTFSAARGRLALADSVAYGGTISGFSKTGASSLDLGDIAFSAKTTTASYAGSTASGVLTVTDGTNTAEIAFEGNYTTSKFQLSGDGEGGTLVVDPRPSATPPAVGRLIGAAAGLGTSWNGSSRTAGLFAHEEPRFLAAPRCQVA